MDSTPSPWQAVIITRAPIFILQSHSPWHCKSGRREQCWNGLRPVYQRGGENVLKTSCSHSAKGFPGESGVLIKHQGVPFPKFGSRVTRDVKCHPSLIAEETTQRARLFQQVSHCFLKCGWGWRLGLHSLLVYSALEERLVLVPSQTSAGSNQTWGRESR